MASAKGPYSGSVAIPGIDAILDKMGATKGEEPSDPIGMEDLKLAAVPLRRMVRSMDRVLSAAEAIAEAGESSGWDRMAITNAIRAWNGQLGKVYRDFVTVRTRMYAISKGYGISTRRPSKKRKARNVYQMSESELEKDLRRVVKGLRPALREVAEKGAFLLKHVDKASRKPSIGLTYADTLTFHFLEFRDAVGGKMFGMINAIVKRLDARSKLARRTALQAHDDKPWYLESRDPRHMSEEDLFAFDARRHQQRAYGEYALEEGDHDPFFEFDMLGEAVSREPVQRAKDRMAASLARGDVKKMVKDVQTRIKRTTNRAKLRGIVTAIGQIMAEPGLSLTTSQKTALQTLSRMASLKLGEQEEMTLQDRLSQKLQERALDMEAHVFVSKRPTSLRNPYGGVFYEIRVTGNTYDIKDQLSKLGLRFAKKDAEPSWKITAGWTEGSLQDFGGRPGKSWGPKFEKMDEIAKKVKAIVQQHNAKVNEKNTKALGLAGYNPREPGWDNAREMVKWLTRIQRQTDRLAKWGIEYGYDTPGDYGGDRPGAVVYFGGNTFPANHIFKRAGFRGQKSVRVKVDGKFKGFKFAWAMPASAFLKISQRLIQDVIAFMEKKARISEAIRRNKPSLGQSRLAAERARALGEYAA